ncbi:MAG: hypothetical protein HF314_03805 [Ignavibacteria bacterium]|jgi:hypothetical protein|nr:hypothetical protein [Ignavibacteria bacterium]MCU7502176.1 hypothetical protein [Ignavibacteria bacterium]MCU7517393.1 hypothetical protein [Ignavibacteria bacterium]
MFLRSRAFIVFSFFVLSMALYSGCKKDDSNPAAAPVTPANPIVGKWVLSSVSVKNTDGTTSSYKPQDLGLSITMEFRNDNTATITTIDSTGTTTESGTYTYNNGVLNLTNTNGEKTTVDIAMSGNKFTTEQTLADDQGNPFKATLEFTKQ